MMTARDVDQLHRDLDTLNRAAAALRAHVADLWFLGWEQANTRDPLEERVSGDGDSPKHDRSLKAGHPAARRLFDQIDVNVAQMAAELVGFERTMRALFFAGSSSAEPSRGSLITAGEHDRLLARQAARRRAGEYVPEKLVDQVQHPGKGRQ